MRTTAACVLCISCITVCRLSAQTTTLLDMDYVNAILQEVSGDIAWKHIAAMAPYERNRPASEYTGDFAETAYMLGKMQEYGFPQAWVEEFSSGSPQWDAEFGEVWMEQPRRERIASYDEIAATLARGSGAVDVRAELVSASDGLQDEDYRGKAVGGKIALVTAARLRDAHALAVGKFGAAGVIGYNADPGQPHPQKLVWDTVDGAISGAPSFGFVVNAATGGRLQALLDAGTAVTLHVCTKTRSFPGKFEVVRGEIPGSAFPEDKFLFIGHLFEGIAKQGANDNLSGPAVELETARTLLRLQREGRLPAFRRPVSFLWMQEIGATKAYLDAHPAEARRFKTGINMDMVGERLSDSPTLFFVSGTPYSQPHFINDLTRNIAEMTCWMNNDALARFPGNPYGRLALKVASPTGSSDPFWCGFLPYDGGSDNTLLSSSEYNIPTVYYEHWPSRYYHSNMDTPARVDPTQLRRVAFMAAVAAAVYGASGPQDVARMLPWFAGRCEERLAQERIRAGNMLAVADVQNVRDQYALARLVMEEAHQREAQALESLGLLAKDGAPVLRRIQEEAQRIRTTAAVSLEQLDRDYRFHCSVKGIPPAAPQDFPDRDRLSRVIPEMIERDQSASGSRKGNTVAGTRYAAWELYNYMNGQRSVYDLWRLLFAEFGGVMLPDVDDFIQAHVKAGHIRLR